MTLRTTSATELALPINLAIQDRDVAACLVKTAEIHGHYCPGSAFGVMATKAILEGDKKGYCRTCAGAKIFEVDGRGIGRENF